MLWLFFYGNYVTILVKFHNAKALRIFYIVTKNRRIAFLCCLHCISKIFTKVAAIEYIVAKYHRTGIISNKVLANEKSLRQAIRTRLYCIGQVNAKLRAIAKQFFKARCIIRRRNNQDILNACQHQCRQRIINHRFIINRQQLLACYLRQRIKSCARAAC